MKRDLSRLTRPAARTVAALAVVSAGVTAWPTQGTPAGPAIDLTTAIAQVAKSAIPAVVHIEVTQRQEFTEPVSPFEADPFFRFFFDVPREPRKFSRELKGLGSGMIMDAAGHILTNNHVVAGATEIDVLLADGNHYKGTLVGRDPKTDLAVISIAAKSDLPHIRFGDSDKVEVGEWVVAIGHPRGLDQTVTQGIISAKHRRGITDPSGYQDFLQTDAAVNPGNSGGPLLNLSGEVVGVNAAIVSESGGFEGISFAIPSNMAQHVARALIAGGKVERGWLGLSDVQDLTPELAAGFGLPSPRGALVVGVVPGGPADRAGLKRRDVILSLAGRDIPDRGALLNEIGGATVGQELKIVVWRAGAKQELVVKVGKPEEANAARAAASRRRLGIGVRAVRAIEARRYGLDQGLGVAIASIDPRSAFAEAGLELGDVLLEVEGQAIQGVDSFADLTGDLKPSQAATWLVLDHRAGRTAYVRIAVP